MIICESALIGIIFMLGIYTSVTDIRYGIVSNKSIILALAAVTLVNIFYYLRYEETFVKLYFVNLTGMIILSVLLYGFHFWAAGDSKLLICMTALIPARLYETGNMVLVPGIYLFVMIFLLAYIYVLSESVIYLFRQKKRYQGNKLTRQKVKSFVVQYLISMLYLTALGSVWRVFFERLYDENIILFTTGNIFAVILINKIQFLRSKICILIITLIDLYVIVFQHGVRFQLISLLILLIIYLLRHFMNEYNYEEIPTEAVKKGMVLSYMVIMQFTRSRVKGLPEETSEDMKSRITEEQAEAIRRWKDSKYGKETIIIVRKIPFAIFIFLGTVVFLTVRTIG